MKASKYSSYLSISRIPSFAMVLAIAMTQATACGKSDEPPADLPNPDPVSEAPGVSGDEGPDHEGLTNGEPVPDPLDPFRARKVAGNATYSSLCPAYGTFSNPVPSPIWLWDCPINANEIALETSVRNTELIGDCKEMLITARTTGMTGEAGDSTWEVMPGGNFYFSFPGETLRFREDGMGNSSCNAKVKSKEFYGKMDCTNPDKPVMKVTTEWNLENDSCAFPAASSDGKKCHLYSYTQITQCE